MSFASACRVGDRHLCLRETQLVLGTVTVLLLLLHQIEFSERLDDASYIRSIGEFQSQPSYQISVHV